MLLVYLLLFLLHLSASSTCHATSRNQHIFLNPGAAHVVRSSAPAIHDHRRIAKDLSYGDAQYPYGMMMRGAMPPQPSLLGADDMRPPDMEITSAAMAPSPSPSPEANNGEYGEGELGGGGGGRGDVSGGDGNGGPSSEAADQEESVLVDYEEPKTHPPSHN
ncbi:hypothetical protein EJB05_09239 [Eragrostis curvula]|uniref:Uncharacterized protein n=1 Tax=Eragrostis curvula TaxID=38414 RepID=A0A5J9W4F6_9POAL|nr:hypothetical protein EJB05_09239 [Eragrostis curvula]